MTATRGECVELRLRCAIDPAVAPHPEVSPAVVDDRPCDAVVQAAVGREPSHRSAAEAMQSLSPRSEPQRSVGVFADRDDVRRGELRIDVERRAVPPRQPLAAAKPGASASVTVDDADGRRKAARRRNGGDPAVRISREAMAGADPDRAVTWVARGHEDAAVGEAVGGREDRQLPVFEPVQPLVRADPHRAVGVFAKCPRPFAGGDGAKAAVLENVQLPWRGADPDSPFAILIDPGDALAAQPLGRSERGELRAAEAVQAVGVRPDPETPFAVFEQREDFVAREAGERGRRRRACRRSCR